MSQTLEDQKNSGGRNNNWMYSECNDGVLPIPLCLLPFASLRIILKACALLVSAHALTLLPVMVTEKVVSSGEGATVIG